MTSTNDERRALVLTVGTGDVERPRETLVVPLTKSIRDGNWSKVVLLPSHLTAEHASQLREQLQDVPIEVVPLRRADMEDNVDDCFEHFNSVIADLKAEGFKNILADFTRGTKAMSAALVLAAVRHDLPSLRYISGPRDERGMVLPGQEIVSQTPVAIVTAQKRLDQARRFFCTGNFAAALEVLPSPDDLTSPEQLRQVTGVVRPMAEFYAAWDRLEYRAGTRVDVPDGTNLPDEWRALYPTKTIRTWVRELAKEWPAENSDRAAYLRCLVADLLANGYRRLRDRQYQDAILRAYRVLELLGQVRLFVHGLDSGALPPEHEAVKELQQKLKKKGSTTLSVVRRTSKLQAGRDQVGRLLKILGDPLGADLLRLGQGDELRGRNTSVLIHGFLAFPVDDESSLQELYQELETLIEKDGGEEAESRLSTARWLDLSNQ